VAGGVPAGVAALRDLVAAGEVLVLSGAGVSTDSGIPAYRDQAGRLRHATPMTIERFLASAEERRRYWARSHVGWPRVAAARPNATHHAVTRLQQAGRLVGVATQNVDGLHTAAGTHGVVDLHGRLDQVVCLGCGHRCSRLEVGLRLDARNPGFRERAARRGSHRPDGDVVLPDELVARFVPVACRRCGGDLKPDVVLFGEPVPRARMRQVLDALEGARTLLVLGSSLAVGTGYRVVTAARRRGCTVAIVTRGATRADHLADLRLDVPLARIVAAITPNIY
jgi:NAD-dependent SIR2 family protein deacetylase